jgi:acyl-CoA synthetase (AMP-forming)/AMP-acid ligase II
MICIPDSAVLIDQVRRLSGPELRREVGAVAGALVNIGVRPRDRVLLLGRKSAELAVALLAVPEAGGIAVAPYAGLTAAQFRHVVDDAAPAFVITFDSSPLAANAALRVGTKVVAYGDLDGTAKASPSVAIGPSDPALIIYTSGSSGKPKGVVFSRENLVRGAESVAEFYGLTAHDRVLCLLPFCFDAGLNQLLAAVRAGCEAHLRDYVLPHHVATVCDEERVTVLTGVPPLWRQLVNIDWPAPARESLRVWGSTGGHVSTDLSRTVCEVFPRASPILMYGFTEAFRATYLPTPAFSSRPTSIGIPIPHSSIALINDAGRLCVAGEPGEIVQFGPLVTKGYWRRPADDRSKFAPISELAREELLDAENNLYSVAPYHLDRAAWSGDMAWIDGEGYLYFQSRKSAVIKTQGFRISPTEIEEACHATGLVNDVVAFGVEQDEEEVVAIAAVTRSADVTSGHLQAELRRLLPAYQVPKVIAMMPEIPVMSNGKYDLRAVRREIEQKWAKGLR